MRATLLLLLLFSVGVVAQTVQSGDLDHDGIADALEQQLLERFQPQVRLSVKECDSRPASFQAGQPDPVAVVRDGTLYGQVSPVTWLPGAGPSVELHYFHLWAKDCGQRGHHLDAEHVSALVHAETADAPVERRADRRGDEVDREQQPK